VILWQIDVNAIPISSRVDWRGLRDAGEYGLSDIRYLGMRSEKRQTGKRECTGGQTSRAHRGWPGEVGQSDFAHGSRTSKRIKESQAIEKPNNLDALELAE